MALIRFEHNGLPIRFEDTPKSLIMDDNDIIGIFPITDGGAQLSSSDPRDQTKIEI